MLSTQARSYYGLGEYDMLYSNLSSSLLHEARAKGVKGQEKGVFRFPIYKIWLEMVGPVKSAEEKIFYLTKHMSV